MREPHPLNQTAEQFQLGRSTGRYGSVSEYEIAPSEIVAVPQTTKTRLFATTLFGMAHY
jgi:hypothetical protein